MFRLNAYIAAVFALQLTACAPADSGDSTPGDGSSEPDRDDDDGTSGGRAAGARAGGGGLASSSGARSGAGGATSAAGGTGARSGGAGTGATAGASTTPVPGELCALFHEGWVYQVATYYPPGEDPIVVSVYGTANFAPDGSYEQNYRIGSISNIYSGNYTLEGDHLTTYDEQGDVAFDYRFECSDELQGLVLILENEDGSPSIVYGLESLMKQAN